jgi:hypothetical protein
MNLMQEPELDDELDDELDTWGMENLMGCGLACLAPEIT